MDKSEASDIENRIERLDASIDRARSELHGSVTTAGRRQTQDRIDHLKYERHQLIQKLSKGNV